MILSFLLIFLLVLLNGFFVSVEFAAVASRRARIEVLADSGHTSARIVKSWLENPGARDRLIAASQLGITIVSLALGAIGENTFEILLEPLFQDMTLPAGLSLLAPVMVALPLILSLIIVTSLHVVLGEQVPKVAALYNPERFAILAAQPMNIFSSVFKWFIDILDWSTRQILSLFGLQVVGEHLNVHTVEELRQILSESEEGGILQTPEREMLNAIFDLNNLVVRQVAVPRTEVIGVEADAPLTDIIELATQSTYTKFPVYEENLDQIVGIVHVKDLLRAMHTRDGEVQTARLLAREAIYIPETASVNVLLQDFRDNRQHIAIVLDEFGGTAGLVTLEDLLEEIVGEVSDPFDAATPEIQLLPNGKALVDGLALIEDVNYELQLHLEDPNYDTIAGYVLGKLGHIPGVRERLESDGVQFTVEAMDGMRIARLLLDRFAETPRQPPASGESPAEE